MKGAFITFEGSEGGGKSGMIRRLASWLRKRGYEVEITKEPGGTPLGKKIRPILLRRANFRIEPLAELLLFYVDRAQHLAEVINPGIKRRVIMLCDRYDDSSVAYQAIGRGLPRQILSMLYALVGGVKPDLTLLLDVDPDVGLRRKRRSGVTNRLDEERLAFHQKVRGGYLQLSQEDPSRWVVIDASQAREAVWQEILTAVTAKLRSLGIERED